jgi:hypothetical protein
MYKPLDPSQREIRILYLLPGGYDDPVRCELHTVSLSNEPGYEALSYSWGNQDIRHAIEVNGEEAYITTNLYNALRRLRLAERTRHIWADALCINQSDDTERSQQVGFMRDIYSSTNEAILWLGDFSDDGESGTGPAITPGDGNYISHETVEVAFSLLRSMATSQHWASREKSEQATTKMKFDALSALLNLSWWQRAWTVQEAVLPKTAVLYCGTIHLPLSEVALAHLVSLTHDRDGCCVADPQCHDVLYKFWDCIESFRMLQEEPDKDILVRMALEMFRFRHATDPRDYVYAYLGLGANAFADYTISPEAAFKYFVRSMIEESKNLGALVRIQEHDRSTALPTWCPDYGRKFHPGTYENLDQEYGWLYMYNWYHAGGTNGSRTRFSAIDSRLDLQGIVLDEIIQVEGPMYTSDSNVEQVSEWQHRDPRECRLGTFEAVGWCTMAHDLWVVLSDQPRDYSRVRTRDGFETVIDEVWEPKAKSQFALIQYQTFTTRTGMVGHSRLDIRVGDNVCVLLGGSMPFILRPVNGHGAYTYIGQAFVHGIMDGEALQQGGG